MQANHSLATGSQHQQKEPNQAWARSSWQAFIRYCADLGHGEIEKLKIQDGVPVMAEFTTRKVKFSP